MYIHFCSKVISSAKIAKFNKIGRFENTVSTGTLIWKDQKGF